MDCISSNSFNFVWVFKGFFNKHGCDFIDASKIGYSKPSLKNEFWNRNYDVIISIHDVNSKILSRESNYTVDVVMWPKFGDTMREVIITSIL